MELTIDRLTKQYKNKIAVDRLSFSLTKGKKQIQQKAMTEDKERKKN